MKQLITKSDGTPTKSKVFAIKFLQDKGIDESCLIQENGQFFYEVVNEEVFAEKYQKLKHTQNLTEWNLNTLNL